MQRPRCGGLMREIVRFNKTFKTETLIERDTERERRMHIRELARPEEAPFTEKTLGETRVSASDVRGIFPLRRTFDEQIRGYIRTPGERSGKTCISLCLVVVKSDIFQHPFHSV